MDRRRCVSRVWFAGLVAVLGALAVLVLIQRSEAQGVAILVDDSGTHDESASRSTALSDTQVYLPMVRVSLVGPHIAGCPIFPTDHIWNTPIDTLPIDANSDAYVNTIGTTTGLHPDFGSGTWAGAMLEGM